MASGAQDVIIGFVRGQDRIDLSAMDARAADAANDEFVFVGTSAFTGAGQVRYVVVGNTTEVQASNDADIPPEFRIILQGVFTLTSADFVL